MKAILINDTSNECHIGSQQVVETIHKYCEKYKIEIVNSFTRSQIVENPRFIIAQGNTVDLVIINGEGTFHHYPRYTLSFFPPLMEGLKGNNKIVLINTVWQDIYYKNLENHLDKIDLISVRESSSYNEIIKIYPEEKVIITPDLIFDLKYLRKHKIGYGDSVYQNDRTLLKEHENYFPLTTIEEGTYEKPLKVAKADIGAYLNWLSSLDLYVTGRFHGVCLALICGIPFLARKSNSHKIEGLLEDIGCNDLLLGSFDEIESKTKQAQEIRESKNEYLIEAPNKIDKMFKRIVEL